MAVVETENLGNFLDDELKGLNAFFKDQSDQLTIVEAGKASIAEGFKAKVEDLGKDRIKLAQLKKAHAIYHKGLESAEAEIEKISDLQDLVAESIRLGGRSE